jgi:hypothetical protein
MYYANTRPTLQAYVQVNDPIDGPASEFDEGRMKSNRLELLHLMWTPAIESWEVVKLKGT